MEDEEQICPFITGLKVKRSAKAEPWKGSTRRGHRELLVVTNTEENRKDVFERSLLDPEIKPEHSSVPIPHHVFGSQIEEVLNFM
jgi:hypothetical protein